MTTATAERPSKAKQGTRPTKKAPEPFNPWACQTLRELSKIAKDAQVSRTAAFEERDELESSLKDVRDDQPDTMQKIKAEIFDVERNIDRLGLIIKKAQNKMIDTIDHGDESDLFPPKKVTVASLFEAPAKATEKLKQRAGRDDDATVGSVPSSDGDADSEDGPDEKQKERNARVEGK